MNSVEIKVCFLASIGLIFICIIFPFRLAENPIIVTDISPKLDKYGDIHLYETISYRTAFLKTNFTCAIELDPRDKVGFNSHGRFIVYAWNLNFCQDSILVYFLIFFFLGITDAVILLTLILIVSYCIRRKDKPCTNSFKEKEYTALSTSEEEKSLEMDTI